MRCFTMRTATILAVLGATGAEGSVRYLRHPFFQNLPSMEIRVEAQSGYGDRGDLPVGLLAAFGIGIGDSWTAGVYGQFYTSDRDLPRKSEMVYGVGGFAEYAWDPDFPLQPYAGLRVGFLDPTGPLAPTLPYLGGYAGVKYALTPAIGLTAAVTYHWAGEDDGFKAYNYRRSSSGYRADDSDLTFDVGVRFAF